MAHIQTIGVDLPQIYAYSTPGITYHDGWLKIGDTTGEFKDRINQQTNTPGIKTDKHLLGFAIYLDGSNKIFRDHKFHDYLRFKGINDQHPDWPGDEWFEISLEDAQKYFNEFVRNPVFSQSHTDIQLREEQEEAIRKMVLFDKKNENGEFLLNAKPRFGKTIAAMEFCKRIDAKKVLILTNRPAVSTSWYSDYCEYLLNDTNYLFVSSAADIKDKEHVISRAEFEKKYSDDENVRYLEFISLEDLKGSIHHGGIYDKLEEIHTIDWDALFLDESHEGVETLKTEFALDRIKRHFTLHLSGTPFKKIKSGQFDTDAIYNWTYVDEQAKKLNWDSSKGENPYEELPSLTMYTYRMSNLVDQTKSIELDTENEFEYAYRLNKFFETYNGRFIHEAEVKKFLHALINDSKFPLSSEENRRILAHSFWLLPSVEATDLLKKLLDDHNEFPEYKDYEVINVAGNIKGKNSSEYAKEAAAYGIVTKAIKSHKRTITLTVNRLTTGVTIPEWTAVFILSEVRSAQLYMQAAFRAQNPCVFNIDGKFYRKTNSYVFDFNPERSLSIIEQFANDLDVETADGAGTYEQRKENIENLLKYLVVSGEDEEGNFKELTSEEVLTIPRTVRSQEVVRLGFMCNYLFKDDFSGIFRAPTIVSEIINALPNSKGGKNNNPVEFKSTTTESGVIGDLGGIHTPGNDNNGGDNTEDNNEGGNDNGSMGVIIKGPDPVQDGEDDGDNGDNNGGTVKGPQPPKDPIKEWIDKTTEEIITKIEDKEQEEMSKSLKQSLKLNIKGRLNLERQRVELDERVEKSEKEKEIRLKHPNLEKERLNVMIDEKLASIEREYRKIMTNKLVKTANDLYNESYYSFRADKVQKEKNEKEEEVRNHLRGFARTIPSFLMAYGNENTTLDNFEKDIPEDVFKDVTSISIDDFKFLRDGGDYMNVQTGVEEHFDGHVFEPTVFNDSVRLFLQLKDKLADYFDESHEEDIFDYIPPQRTNQIYTPKKVVKNMVDFLEENDPGCFDNPDKTYIDPYMKSGLYITEIVKRLYTSKKMKKAIPDDKKRLRHIFEKQIYGLAPTEILYRITTNFIFGFDKENKFDRSHFRCYDALPACKEGKLEEELDKLFK